MWDLERENCIAQLSLPGPAAAGGSAGAAAAAAAGVEHIATSASSPLLYAADAAGTGEGEGLGCWQGAQLAAVACRGCFCWAFQRQ